MFVMPCFLSIKVERKANFLLDIISLRASAAAVVKKAKKRRGFSPLSPAFLNRLVIPVLRQELKTVIDTFLHCSRW